MVESIPNPHLTRGLNFCINQSYLDKSYKNKKNYWKGIEAPSYHKEVLF
jgi:hypothetical protein